jgi:hypothetical protein
MRRPYVQENVIIFRSSHLSLYEQGYDKCILQKNLHFFPFNESFTQSHYLSNKHTFQISSLQFSKYYKLHYLV